MLDFHGHMPPVAAETTWAESAGADIEFWAGIMETPRILDRYEGRRDVIITNIIQAMGQLIEVNGGDVAATAAHLSEGWGKTAAEILAIQMQYGADRVKVGAEV